ncbi:MAG: hypothetical protein COA44_13035 [Arcobacter sp.]|nr:MAG: hypothetical protein COA44_13035 [Arcobacter sp.]
MHYTLEGTTKRYAGNKGFTFDDFNLSADDTYQFGCEFEFYIKTSKYDYGETIDKITEEVYSLTGADILVDTTNLPTAYDKNHCIQIKPDVSLKDNGIEISVPITTEDGIVHYIQTITSIIQKYGYTNQETGFHIHISTIDNNGVNFNFYKFMLLCHTAELLSSWKQRPGYSQNVMDVLSSNTKQQARVIKTKKGTIWNLEKVEPNHVEIKSIGGEDYHKNIHKIIEEFLQYTQLFIQTLHDDTEGDREIYRAHKEQLDTLSRETEETFATALSEAGIV